MVLSLLLAIYLASLPPLLLKPINLKGSGWWVSSEWLQILQQFNDFTNHFPELFIYPCLKV